MNHVTYPAAATAVPHSLDKTVQRYVHPIDLCFYIEVSERLHASSLVFSTTLPSSYLYTGALGVRGRCRKGCNGREMVGDIARGRRDKGIKDKEWKKAWS